MKLRVLLGLAACGLLMTGCANSFNREWKTAATASHSGAQGRWAGEWRSEKNGHHGALRAVVTQATPTTYRAHYYAKFFKIFHYTYVATLTGSEADTNGVVRLAGEADLGKLAGGVYTYEGTANATNFQSSYKCKYDRGQYHMTRP
jgi:hypothetical protein